MNQYPLNIFSGEWNAGHVQGISVDQKNRYIYYSFTTVMVKSDFEGNIIGTVVGLTGHLGCIKFNPADGKLYGSIEYKNDAIGKGIRKRLGIEDVTVRDSFYIAIFDCDRIDRLDMDAEKDGVMTTVYLRDPSDDFAAQGTDDTGKVSPHRYGCSGIDGLTFGPAFGSGPDAPCLVTVAYGIYDDVNRADNDYQVLLRYDVSEFDRYAKPPNQLNPHTSGPEAPVEKLFVYTGNTCWGVQNLEYDPAANTWYMAVYCGHKPNFPNRALYLIDGAVAAVLEPLRGHADRTPRPVLYLKQAGLPHESGIYGYSLPTAGFATTGLESLGNGLFYISQDGRNENGQFSHVKLYRADEEKAFVSVEQ